MKTLDHPHTQNETNRFSRRFSVKSLTILIVFSFAFISSLSAQKIESEEIVDFKIYEYKNFPEDQNYKNYSAEQYSKMSFYQVPLDAAKRAFGNPERLLTNYQIKGSYFAVVELRNGDKKRIQISNFGVFYKDLDTNKEYDIPMDNKKKFDDILMAAYKHLKNNSAQNNNIITSK